MDLAAVAPSGALLAAAIVLDLLIGDPVYRWHPVRLMGATLEFFESALRRVGMDGYAGGCALFVLLAAVWAGGITILVHFTAHLSVYAAMGMHLFLLYSLIAFRDLLDHALAVERAARAWDVSQARTAIARLVGRDTARMDLAACRRASIESLSENLVDGFMSPLFYYVFLGLPGIVLFKVISTMDSMVGYKTPRYLRFGWCGARLDDLLNLIPARISWLLIGLCALPMRGCSAVAGWRTGWQQHAVVPGPNSGWSEASIAGALRRRLIGPIWAGGALVANVWLGRPEDPEAGQAGDVVRACLVISLTALVFTLLLWFAGAAAATILKDSKLITLALGARRA